MYGNTNKVMGNHFEADLCDLLSEAGWWAHNMAQNETGQPADVIAVKCDHAVLIDCKVCSNDTFPLTRIEANQEGAMTLWEECGNCFCYFALKMTDGRIYMVNFDSVSEPGKSVLHEKDIRQYEEFSDWLVDMDTWLEERECM